MNDDIEGGEEVTSPRIAEIRTFVDRTVRFLAIERGIMQFVAMISMDVRTFVAIDYENLLRMADTARPFALIMSRILDVIDDQERPHEAVLGASGHTLHRPIEAAVEGPLPATWPRAPAKASDRSFAGATGTRPRHGQPLPGADDARSRRRLTTH